MKPLSGWPEQRAGRHATALLYDSAECRMVAFTLAPHQEVKVHSSASTVLCTVLRGSGKFLGGDSTASLQAGESIQYAPNEPHGMVADGNGLYFLAVITPGPGARAS